jgi:hypothetical protein
MDSPGQTVLLTSEKIEMDLGRLKTILKMAWSADSKM